jgi:epoxyqueuosine reductase
MPISISEPAAAAADAKADIRAVALAEGFETVGFTRPDAIPGAGAGLLKFLADGREGDMAWLAREPGIRASPATLWPEARSVVALGQNYGPDRDPREDLEARGRAAVSVYARGRDYHDVVKSRLKRVGRHIADRHGAGVKVFVDTAPVMEKPLAAAAGIGWQGKHTNLVSRDFGSWLFLGIILTTLELAPDAPEADHCGTCRACLDACPTAAFTGAYEIDARRCISYLTIEHKGHIPVEFRSAIGNRVYGCDDCLAACPWNKFASRAAEAKLHARADLEAPDLAGLARLDDAAFRARFSGSPIKRTGRDRFVRNVLVAIGNSADAGLGREAMRRLDDASPLVRAAAVWALFRLLDGDAFAALRARHAAAEADPDVLAEWARGTGP